MRRGLKEESLERETTIGGPVSEFQTAAYQLGYFWKCGQPGEIAGSGSPVPCLPSLASSPIPSYSVSEPRTAQEVNWEVLEITGSGAA